MKARNIVAVLTSAAFVVACGMGLMACSSNSSDEETDSDTVSVYDTSEGVAATVGDVEIGEKVITQYIQDYRDYQGLSDDSSWAQWLVDNDYTAEDIRSQVVDYYVDQEVLRAAAAENGIEISDDEIQAQIDSIKAYYDSDEDWASALATYGMTEDSYKSMVELQMLEDTLKESLDLDTTISDDDAAMYAQMFASSYSGAKKSSHILFSADDEATAQQVLDDINAGNITFEEAAEEYSTDTSSAADGGNVGWDATNSFVDEYQTALDGLEPGEISGLVTSSYGIHIIMCTDEYVAPDDITTVTLADIPQEWQDQITSYLESAAEDTAYNEWFEQYEETLDITINDMPEGLVYDVDLTGVTPSDEATDDTTTVETTDDTTADESATDETATDDETVDEEATTEEQE